MAYIGNAPISGVFKKIDNISGLFNGSTTTFAINVASVAQSVATAQNILIVISGVLQEPGVAYSISGTNIVFSSAPVVTDSFFGVILGSVGVANYTKDIGVAFFDKGTVSSGTVTFDYNTGAAQRLQVGGGLTIALSNFPQSGNFGKMTLELVNVGAFTVTFPVINWLLKNGTFTTSIGTYATNIGRTLQVSGTDFIEIWTRDGGATFYGTIVGY